MNASHISLRDDYETSCEETDILADLAWKIPGVLWFPYHRRRIRRLYRQHCERMTPIDTFIRQASERHTKKKSAMRQNFM